MKCKICGQESGKYPLCRACNNKKDNGEVIKCEKCGNWHYITEPCPVSKSTTDNDKYLYDVKRTLISKSEQSFYIAIKSSVPEEYCVFPQINLASFITRTDDSRFHNELFRNIDFLITDAEYKPKIIIEINDQTHLTSERKERDEKVRKICEEAGIPIVKLWTSYGINQEYIKEKITMTLNKPITRFHHFSHISQDPVTQQTPIEQPSNATIIQRSTEKKGCYVATCVYGSYDCPEVWVLRRYRDHVLSSTFIGRRFIKAYYTVSPTLVKLFGNQKWFVGICKALLDTVIKKLQIKDYETTPYEDI